MNNSQGYLTVVELPKPIEEFEAKDRMGV